MCQVKDDNVHFKMIKHIQMTNFSKKLGGDKIPRKGGPGITQSDLLVRYYMTIIPILNDKSSEGYIYIYNNRSSTKLI